MWADAQILPWILCNKIAWKMGEKVSPGSVFSNKLTLSLTVTTAAKMQWTIYWAKSVGKQAAIQFENNSWRAFGNTNTCPRIHGSGRESKNCCMHEFLWYSRSKDLSNFILIRDISGAVVAPPISQGKAAEWHGDIHLEECGQTKRWTFGVCRCESKRGPRFEGVLQVTDQRCARKTLAFAWFDL